MWHHLYTHAINSSQTITITPITAPHLHHLSLAVLSQHLSTQSSSWYGGGDGDNVSVSARQRNVSLWFPSAVRLWRDAFADRARLLCATTNGTPEIKNLLFYALCAMRLGCHVPPTPKHGIWCVNELPAWNSFLFLPLRLFATHTKTHSSTIRDHLIPNALMHLLWTKYSARSRKFRLRMS